jgi:signal transduction histidine kinase
MATVPRGLTWLRCRLLEAAERTKLIVSKGVSAWPLTARVSAVTGLLIFVVAIVISHISMAWIFQQQEAGLRRLSEVYLDGIAMAVLPAVAAEDATQTTAVLKRAFLFNEGMREFELIILTPQGTPFARVVLPGKTSLGLDDRMIEDLYRNRGIVFDESKGVGWVYRELIQDNRALARIYAQIDVSDLQHERRVLRVILAAFTVVASGISALLGFVVIKRMVRPLHVLTARLQGAHRGGLAPVPEAELPAAATEFGDLLRGFNGMVRAFLEREGLAASLAAQEQAATLGHLAATVAHEVYNPLAGMFNAVDTGRKFGHDARVRTQSFDLIERGLWSIRNIVGALLASHRMPEDRRALTPEDLEDLRILVDPEARRIGVDLEWQSTIDQCIPVDATQVRQIGLNLLLNACAVSADGHVGFTAEFEGKAMRFLVEDDGPGLIESVEAALGACNLDEKQGPPMQGIGLSVVNRLVHELGGRIVAQRASTRKGACIAVTIPINEQFLSHVASQ